MKQIKYFILIAFAIISFVACNRPSPSQIPVGTSYIRIKLADIKGDNLLATKLYGDSIEIYHIYPCGHTVLDCINVEGKGIVKTGFSLSKDKQYVEVNIGSGEGIWSHIDNGQLIYPFEQRSGQTFTTYIKWNSQDTDTIITTFIDKKDVVETNLIPVYIGWINTYDKVYYNDSVVIESYREVLNWYPQYNGGVITIVK